MSCLTFNTTTLGRSARDTATGLEGVITARSEHLGGASQVLISPPVKDGQPFCDGRWVDTGRCEYTDQNHEADQAT